MNRMRGSVLLLGLIILGLVVIEMAQAEMAPQDKQAAGFDMKQVDRGRYLSKIIGCNDCHIPGYGVSGEQSQNRYGLQATVLDGEGRGGRPTQKLTAFCQCDVGRPMGGFCMRLQGPTSDAVV